MDDEGVFRALVDPSRRLLLDRLYERDGQTLGELSAALPGMTRQAVMKHLRTLEASDLVVTQRQGRQKLHFLNPMPIRLIHDRWISRYTARLAGAIGLMKAGLEGTMEPIKHVYQTYIRTSPRQLWDAITDGRQTARYYYGTAVKSDWKAGSALVYTYADGTVAADGTVLAVDPPSSVTIEMNPKWDEATAAEPPVRMTWAITPMGDVCRLTVTTEDLVPGSATAQSFEGGIVFIVSGLKSLLETGEPLKMGAGSGAGA
jgi:uncharacterized protein YndB with AHSA1/START domain/DNA-binding transcriptional ArsR family regulator